MPENMNSQTNIHFNATGVGNKDSFNVINNYNNTYVEDKSQVLEWLSPLEPRARHQDVRTSRLDGVGEWFLQKDEFVHWRDGKDGFDRGLLFCSGAPGVGKTYLSSLVIDTLCDQSAGRKVAVTCFYCDFQHQKTQTPENILGALVKQLIRALGVVPTEIDSAFRKAKCQVGGRGLRISELLPLLQVALTPVERAFICIDALDECAGKHLPELLRSLHTISQWSSKMRLFITGRPHIQREIERHFPGGAQFVEIKPTTEDIMKYLKMMLDNDSDPEAMNADLRAEIVKRVLETISDVFLLVSLNIAAVLAEATIYGRREQLKRMTNGLGLGDAYRVALNRIEAQGGARSGLGMATLMWISLSERPMTTDELCHALGVQIGSTDLNPETIPPIQTLLASCHGLVTVDKAGSTVRFVHLTFQEYLDSHPEIFRNPYATMAEICLTYLNYDCVKKLSPCLYYAPPATLFLEYASIYWGPYARKETTEEVKSLALPLLINFDNHISAKLLLFLQVYELRYEPASKPERFSGLHCVAYLGIDEIASTLLEIKDGDINGKDFLGRTPLMWAAKNGCEGIIKQLLKQKDINFRAKDVKYGRTPLSWAAEGGCEGIIRLLLDQEEVGVDSRDNSGRTPLSYAAQSWNEGAVKLFLELEGVNPESRDNGGRTPLSWAAGWASREVVKLLLGRRDVNAESRDNDGRTPLSWAVVSGKVETVKLLLDWEEVNAESQDNDGRTPLSWAAELGKVETVKLLLDLEEVNTELQDNNGRTPLSWAATSRNERAVKLLLERRDVNAESRDNDGRTPLSWAVVSGKMEAVELLLEREEVNAESRDNNGRTPLSHAAESGRIEVVKLFLEQIEVNAESRDNSDRTPLSYASCCGPPRVVELFLEREEVNVESRDEAGRTPLSWAAESGDEELVKLFLKRKEVNAESQDYDGRTPLSYAAEWGSIETMKLFLERAEVNAKSRDNDGMTPLSYASEGGNEGVVELFLQWEEVNTESRDNHSRVPLLRSSRNSSEEPGAVNPRSRTLLGNEEVVRLSQEHLDAMPVIQYHHTRVPNACTNKFDLGEESLVQFPPHQGPTPKHSAPPPTHPVPPEAGTVGSLDPSPQPPRRRFSLAFEDEPLTHITPKRRTPS